MSLTEHGRYEMSLEIKKVSEEETITVVLGGRLDTTTAP